MLNLIKTLIISGSISFLMANSALANVSSCYRNQDQKLLFTATAVDGNWEFVSALRTNVNLVYTPCYYNSDASLILTRSAQGGRNQIEIAILPGTNRTQGVVRVGDGRSAETCSEFGITTSYEFTCDNPIP